jgi:hypothetical protein
LEKPFKKLDLKKYTTSTVESFTGSMKAALFSQTESLHFKCTPIPSPGVFGSPKAKEYTEVALFCLSSPLNSNVDVP